VSDFELVCVLGIGSRGKVLLAHHRNSPDLYALKVIAKRRVLASQEVQRTLSEQAVLRRMAIDGTKPFVVKLWRSFHDEDNLYLVMVCLAFMYLRLLLN
jgi:serine/threonine protein kinase